MYLGIDFLIGNRLEPYVIEVNLGLPGGAQEYHLTHLVRVGKPADVFESIENISHEVYGRPFRDYLGSLPFLKSLKRLKLWLDGQGPFPEERHPALRLEDKWVQHRILSPHFPMPLTIPYDPGDPAGARAFFRGHKRLVLKRRLGRGGRDFKIVEPDGDLDPEIAEGRPCLLQEHIDSRAGGYHFSIRSVAFGGRHICLYANLATRPNSNHGILVHVESGGTFGLADQDFGVRSFDGRAWEAGIWFGDEEPAYLRHNLYEDQVAATALVIPQGLLESIKHMSIRIERLYESLDFETIPRACFESEAESQLFPPE